MKKILLSSALVIAATVISSASWADSITYTFTGTLQNVSGAIGSFTLENGDLFTQSYTFDNTTDQNSDPDIGAYIITDTSTSIATTGGSIVFEASGIHPVNTGLLQSYNDFGSSPATDSFTIYAYPADTDPLVDQFQSRIDLYGDSFPYDPAGRFFTATPDFTTFSTSYSEFLFYDFGTNEYIQAYGNGTVTSFTVSTAAQPTNPVPEPATMLLFGAGLVGIAGCRAKKKTRGSFSQG